MMCAVNTDFYIMPDRTWVVDGMALFRICYVFIYTSFPLVLECCSAVACSMLSLDDWGQGAVFGHHALLLFQSCKGFAFDKGFVINLLDVYIYCSTTAGMFPFPADIEAWRTL